MKKYFNGKGTISGWAAILRGFVPAILINVLINPMMIMGIHEDSPVWLLLVIPTIVLSIWFLLSTGKKRMQAYGWKGGYLNLIFPNLTNASYPNGKESEE